MPSPAPTHLAHPPYPPGVGVRLAERFRAWRHKRRWISEVQHATALGRLDSILEDVGMTRAELDELMAAPADAGSQFAQMAELEGVDLTTLPAEVVRDATWTCTRCVLRKECKRWLRTGVWQHDGDPRCPNAHLLHH